jgi:hypothetical protein
MRKVTFEKNGVEEKRLRTVEHFVGRTSASAAYVLTAVSGVRENSYSTSTTEETEDLPG